MFDVNELPIHKQFSRRLIKPDTWLINSYNPSMESPNPYVLIGDDLALVIDPTDTKQNIREYIETCVTDKPLIVANTHSHADHTLCNGLFNDRPIYMSEIAWEETKENRRTGYDGKAKDYIIGDYVPIIVKEGDVLELGNRPVEVIDFGGCHSASSIAYLDKKYRILFPGDEMESGQVLMQGTFRGGFNCVERYRDNLLHLLKYRDQFDTICPPHNGSPMDAGIIDAFLENCDRILSGIEGEKDIGSISYLLGPNEPRPAEKVQRLRFDPNSRRSEWKGTSIVYSTDRIFNKDIENEK